MGHRFILVWIPNGTAPYVPAFLGPVLMVMALIFTLTGRCLVKFQGIINRAKDPKEFFV